MATIREILAFSSQELKNKNIDNPQLEARILLSHTLKISREKIFLEEQNSLSEHDRLSFLENLNRRLAHEPIAYICGEKDFWKHTFQVTPNTLIPRPDSEILIETVLQEWRTQHPSVEPRYIIDIGTGSGCLLISLLDEYKKSFGIGVDVSLEACKIAQNNANRLNLTKRCKIINAQWVDVFGLITPQDIVISNPPYIPLCQKGTLSLDLNFEPQNALYAGSDGLAGYKAIACGLRIVTAPSALVFLEIGYRQSKDVINIFEKESFYLHNICKDLQNIPRCLSFIKK